jgi:hypothetical protein
VNVNRLSKPHWWQERLRSAPTTKGVLAAALLILLALGAPVHADDPIAEWLKQRSACYASRAFVRQRLRTDYTAGKVRRLAAIREPPESQRLSGLVGET